MKGRGVGRYILYIGSFLFLTALFSVYGFPTERVTGIISARLRSLPGAAIEIREASISFPWSLRLEGVSAAVSGVSFDLGNATVSPDLPAFFTGAKGIRIRTRGGAVTAGLSIRLDGSEANVRSDHLDVDLAGLSEILSLPVRMEGHVLARFDLASGDLDGNRWNGKGELLADSLRIEGDLLDALAVGSLDLSALKATFSLEDNLLALTENDVQGDIAATARGTVGVVPGKPLNSRLDLFLELRPGAGKREKLIPLLTLMGARPGKDGSVQLRIRGTLGRPAVTS